MISLIGLMYDGGICAAGVEMLAFPVDSRYLSVDVSDLCAWGLPLAGLWDRA